MDADIKFVDKKNMAQEIDHCVISEITGIVWLNKKTVSDI